jgi:hypothetical protein
VRRIAPSLCQFCKTRKVGYSESQNLPEMPGEEKSQGGKELLQGGRYGSCRHATANAVMVYTVPAGGVQRAGRGRKHARAGAYGHRQTDNNRERVLTSFLAV